MVNEQENKVLELTKDLMWEFNQLDHPHPSANSEVAAAIHQIQGWIAILAARRMQPEIWFE